MLPSERALRRLTISSQKLYRTPAAGLGKRAESFVAERKAAAKFGALRPKLSMRCPKPPEERQGGSAAGERPHAFPFSWSARFIGARAARYPTEMEQDGLSGRRLERVPLPASNAAPCSYWKHQNAPTLPSRLAEACFLVHFGLRGCKAGFSVQPRWMLRRRERGCVGCCALNGGQKRCSDLAAQPLQQMWLGRGQEALAWLVRVAPCAGGAALLDCSFRGWTRRGAPFCAAASFRRQMRCAQAA